MIDPEDTLRSVAVLNLLSAHIAVGDLEDATEATIKIHALVEKMEPECRQVLAGTLGAVVAVLRAQP